MTSRATAPTSLVIRRATAADIDSCANICYQAFATINAEHNFPPDFPSSDVARHVLSSMFVHPRFFCVVAELAGKVVGSNCLDERDSIAGVGPITVDPSAQDVGAGRRLMAAVMERAAERNFAGVRLVQAAFHNRSMSLYAKLGFDIREPLAVMQGTAIRKTPAGYSVRPAKSSDLDACAALCLRVHGHHRSGEMTEAMDQGTAVVAEQNGRVTAYASIIGFFGHAVAENNEGLQALIGAAEEFAGPGFLLPTRNTQLFRWCLRHGLRVVEPMTLMSFGLYNEPAGAFLPSINF
jgi:GNAT superfamily N-acetyltransferase